MPYRKANRDLTDEQFSEGTTIDGSRIDSAIEGIIKTQNNIPHKNTEALWTPTTYVMCWTPPRSQWRFYANPIDAGPQARYGVNRGYSAQAHTFPFMNARNDAANVFPFTEQPVHGINNEYRNKGFFYDPPQDYLDEGNYTSGGAGVVVGDINNSNTTLHSIADQIVDGAGPGDGTSFQQVKYMVCTFPFYFSKPVIIMDISVFAAQEHPTSFFNSFEDLAGAPFSWLRMNTDGYKDRGVLVANQEYYESTNPCANLANSIESVTEGLFNSTDAANALPAATGFEFPGELYTYGQQNIGAGTIQVSVDNEFLPEKRELNNVIFNKTRLGDTAHRFNNWHTTNSTAAHPLPLTGEQYTDMTPAYPGGSTWGVWIKEGDLNIPVPRDSRVRFSVINKGFRASQLFEWNCAITVLERVEE